MKAIAYRGGTAGGPVSSYRAFVNASGAAAGARYQSAAWPMDHHADTGGAGGVPPHTRPGCACVPSKAASGQQLPAVRRRQLWRIWTARRGPRLCGGYRDSAGTRSRPRGTSACALAHLQDQDLSHRSKRTRRSRARRCTLRSTSLASCPSNRRGTSTSAVGRQRPCHSSATTRRRRRGAPRPRSRRSSRGSSGGSC